jgi:hypothetical protein
MENIIMAQYRKKPVVIKATQWFQNGDHPGDHDPIGIKNPTSMDIIKYQEHVERYEGVVVRRYRTPDIDGETICKYCGDVMHNHGYIETLEGGHIVCPGDYIITGVHHELYPCKPEIFWKTYEKV